ncbi:LppM family (lipo)protein [Demequina salsinemoris]|uniref:LppM family (lipo)protein n=1 Tax=Demequina salsinemoris TaxID=577470 RepID=UPI0007863956|nr:hypothetical protein [Demequina salsinemoris]
MEFHPEAPRPRRLRTLASAGVLALALAGCVRLDSATELKADDTFDQHLVIALAPDIGDELSSGAASGLGSGLGDLTELGDAMDGLSLEDLDPSALYDELADSEELQAFEDEHPGHVTLEPYDDGELVGVELTLTDLPLSLYDQALAGAGADVGLAATIEHADGEFVVTIPADEARDASSLGLTSANLALLGSAVEVEVSFTFPGLVTEAPDGTAEGRTATLALEDLLTPDEIRIVASDERQIYWAPILTWGGIVLAAIVIVGGATLLVLQDVRARRHTGLPAPDARHESRIGTLEPDEPEVAPDDDSGQEEPPAR